MKIRNRLNEIETEERAISEEVRLFMNRLTPNHIDAQYANQREYVDTSGMSP